MTLRTYFTAELQHLQTEILALGSMVDKAIGRSVDALKRLDHTEARRIIEADKDINAVDSPSRNRPFSSSPPSSPWPRTSAASLPR